MSVTRTSLGFVLVDGFSMMAFVAATEPLRIANRLLGRAAYAWTVISEDGAAVTASNGMRVLPDADMRLARGLKNQSVELGKTLDLCALDDIPGDISAPLKDMKELIGDLQQSLDEFQA